MTLGQGGRPNKAKCGWCVELRDISPPKAECVWKSNMTRRVRRCISSDARSLKVAPVSFSLAQAAQRLLKDVPSDGGWVECPRFTRKTTVMLRPTTRILSPVLYRAPI